MKAGYKKTGIGIIPKDWDIVALKEYLDYEQPTKYLVNSTDYDNYGDTAVLTANKSFLLGYTNEKVGIFNNFPVIIFDDFTTASKFVNFPFKVKSSALKILKLKNDFADIKFIFEKMQIILFHLSSHKRYWIAEYQNIPISMPKLEEQKAIATVLSDVDGLIESLEQLIAKKRDIKTATMQQLLTGKKRLPDFVVKQGCKKTDIGIIPKDWNIVTLKEYLDYEQPTKYLVNSTDYDDYGDIAVLTANKSFLLGYTNEKVGIFNNFPVIIFDDFTTASKFVNFPFKVKSSALKILKLKNDFADIKFLFEKMQIISSHLSSHKRYWIAEYQNIQISVPKLEEQKAIATVLSDMDAEIDTLEQRLEKTKAIKAGMMQELLTGKTRLIKANKEVAA